MTDRKMNIIRQVDFEAKLCQNEDCAARIHQYCLNNIFSQRKSGRVCSRCGTKWQYEGQKEEAVGEDDEPTMAGQSQAPPAPKRKKPRISDAGECCSQASVASSELRRVTCSSASAR